MNFSFNEKVLKAQACEQLIKLYNTEMEMSRLTICIIFENV